ncbi:MAG: 50S ribosomal protein L17 [Candidatus Nealsonbacteria bacterium CG09_land_8_20_14_0_10_42_14]|uniref:Large ribosomal subunit protein bL17 n=1 Tax=Candidatus Nealsonbacteria bacterium CG09_land_8_20_14_0_10_42_14 TaxID=1974707 RepID=A0A2H0WXM8_9BACT|nr:MAG: 50S ribosomal protein L17 [Candidatus Nealsonbacteria bacterium CG09_land_8_20_14_0_10_42_14]
MRKRKKGRKLSRQSGQRRALMKALVSALVSVERIKTTETKAKETAPIMERLISRAKKGDLASRRLLLKFLSLKLVKKLIEEIAPRYRERKGGYTRIIKLGPRQTDGARMAIIEFVK